MNFELLKSQLIDASRISDGSRWSRLARHPIRTLLPYAMRKLSIQRAVDLDTVWGGRFSGILPEAVTSEIWRSGSFELHVGLALLEYLKPGSCYIDVGAHFGYFSLFASKLVGPTGRVLSVEAMPSTFQYLTENVRKNAAYQNVTIFQGAAYSESAELVFRDFGVVASSLNSAFTARDNFQIIRSAGVEVIVQAHPVDSLIEKFDCDKIDLIKIDAESSEKFVLQGLKNTLAKFRPTIVMEVGDANLTGNSVGEILSQMSSAGYTAYSRDQNNRLNKFRQAGHVAYANLVFLPSEKMLPK